MEPAIGATWSQPDCSGSSAPNRESLPGQATTGVKFYKFDMKLFRFAVNYKFLNIFFNRPLEAGT